MHTKLLLVISLLFVIIFSQNLEETFELKSGIVIKGERISETSDTITLKTVFGEIIINKIEILEKYYKVKLISGEVITGNKINENELEVFFETPIGKIPILKDNIIEMIQSNPDGTPLRQSIVESKKQEFTKGEEVLTDIFLEPTANMLEKGSLYVSGLSFGFGVTDKLSISSKFLGFIIGNFNFRPKYQIFKSGNWENQKALAVGFHYATRFNGRFPYSLGTWKEGAIEIPKYQGEYIKHNYLDSDAFPWSSFDEISNCSIQASDDEYDEDCKSGLTVWQQTGPDETETFYWGGYYAPGTEIDVDKDEFLPEGYNKDYDSNNAIFESGPYYHANIDNNSEDGPFSNGNQMLELFGVYTWSKAKDDKKGRTEHTIGANVKLMENIANNQTLVFPRLYYGITTDVNPKLKMVFMTFYDPHYIPAYKLLLDEVNYNSSYYYYNYNDSNSSTVSNFDCYDCGNDDQISTNEIIQPTLKPLHADFGFVYSISPTLRVSLHFQQPWIGFYWKL